MTAYANTVSLKLGEGDCVEKVLCKWWNSGPHEPQQHTGAKRSRDGTPCATPLTERSEDFVLQGKGDAAPFLLQDFFSFGGPPPPSGNRRASGATAAVPSWVELERSDSEEEEGDAEDRYGVARGYLRHVHGDTISFMELCLVDVGGEGGLRVPRGGRVYAHQQLWAPEGYQRERYLLYYLAMPGELVVLGVISAAELVELARDGKNLCAGDLSTWRLQGPADSAFFRGQKPRASNTMDLFYEYKAQGGLFLEERVAEKRLEALTELWRATEGRGLTNKREQLEAATRIMEALLPGFATKEARARSSFGYFACLLAASMDKGAEEVVLKGEPLFARAAMALWFPREIQRVRVLEANGMKGDVCALDGLPANKRDAVLSLFESAHGDGLPLPRTAVRVRFEHASEFIAARTALLDGGYAYITYPDVPAYVEMRARAQIASEVQRARNTTACHRWKDAWLEGGLLRRGASPEPILQGSRAYRQYFERVGSSIYRQAVGRARDLGKRPRADPNAVEREVLWTLNGARMFFRFGREDEVMLIAEERYRDTRDAQTQTKREGERRSGLGEEAATAAASTVEEEACASEDRPGAAEKRPGSPLAFAGDRVFLSGAAGRHVSGEYHECGAECARDWWEPVYASLGGTRALDPGSAARVVMGKARAVAEASGSFMRVPPNLFTVMLVPMLAEHAERMKALSDVSVARSVAAIGDSGEEASLLRAALEGGPEAIDALAEKFLPPCIRSLVSKTKRGSHWLYEERTAVTRFLCAAMKDSTPKDKEHVALGFFYRLLSRTDSPQAKAGPDRFRTTEYGKNVVGEVARREVSDKQGCSCWTFSEKGLCPMAADAEDQLRRNAAPYLDCTGDIEDVARGFTRSAGKSTKELAEEAKARCTAVFYNSGGRKLEGYARRVAHPAGFFRNAAKYDSGRASPVRDASVDKQ